MRVLLLDRFIRSVVRESRRPSGSTGRASRCIAATHAAAAASITVALGSAAAGEFPHLGGGGRHSRACWSRVTRAGVRLERAKPM
jgi:hypothetical protein